MVCECIPMWKSIWSILRRNHTSKNALVAPSLLCLIFSKIQNIPFSTFESISKISVNQGVPHWDQIRCGLGKKSCRLAYFFHQFQRMVTFSFEIQFPRASHVHIQSYNRMALLGSCPAYMEPSTFIDWLIGWSIDWLVGWLVDWLIGL